MFRRYIYACASKHMCVYVSLSVFMFVLGACMLMIIQKINNGEERTQLKYVDKTKCGSRKISIYFLWKEDCSQIIIFSLHEEPLNKFNNIKYLGVIVVNNLSCSVFITIKVYVVSRMSSWIFISYHRTGYNHSHLIPLCTATPTNKTK